MLFEHFWPLLFSAAIPIIIILYLLKPKGIDHRISSNLLWQKLLKNEQSRTFFEKFVHNLLMYVQILTVLLLVVALMSPLIQVNGTGGGRTVLLLDTSGSMQHRSAGGKSRLEEAVAQACEYVKNAGDVSISVVTVNESGAELLAVDGTDSGRLTELLQGLECTDCGSSLTAAQSVLDTLMGEGTEGADFIVFTDGAGAADFANLHGNSGMELRVVGEAASNLANEYTVFGEREDGRYDVMVSVANHSDEAVTFDVSLTDASERVIALTQMQLAPSESNICLMEGIDWQGETLSSELSNIVFQGGGRDSLAADNYSAAVKNKGNFINGLLVGEGNTFLEKAYAAVTGSSITKSKTDAAAGDSFPVVIYDAGQKPELAENSNKLLFGDGRGEAAETLENVTLDVTDCDMLPGLSGFTIGVNKAYCFAVPEGAESFLECQGKCVGYYGERDGRKEVVVGFDIRESDFPLRAEFPVFLANSLMYLSNTSWLASNVYYAGEEIVLQPWAEPDMTQVQSRPSKAGLYSVGNEEYRETYVVRFQTATESEGRAQAESVAGTGALESRMVKKTLRNLFLILVLCLLALEWFLYVRQMRYRGTFYLAVRGAVFVCVLLALLGPEIRLGSNRAATVFVVDLSNSNEAHLAEAEEYLRETIRSMPAGNSYGIVTFGKNALVEQFLTDENHYAGLLTAPEKVATNYEEALSRALTLLPAEQNGRVVVLTDGKQTSGDIQHMAQALTGRQIEFLTLLYESASDKDAYIENVTLPAYLHPGDKYSVTVLVESNYDADATLSLYNGSRQALSNAVHLNKGRNRFVFSQVVGEDSELNGLESLRVQIKAEGDSCAENDVYSAYSMVEAAPKILVISGLQTTTSAFRAVLNAAGCDYSVVSAINAPSTIESMLEYKSIVLVDTYIDDLPVGFLENLETYVKDYGCGFVCCGGEDSFALGGYRDTVLETVLPVNMQLRSVNEKASMAMVMVIDHSGSMLGGGPGTPSNLDVAIKAATVAVDNLQDSDYVGVLTFDDRFEWQVQLTQADKKKEIQDAIKTIKDGGGTTIKPAVKEAFDVISQSEASIKHVILLTDGMGETTDYSDVIKSYRNSGVTLSTVAMGSDADTKLLEQLAKSCGGRYYHADVAGNIPKIFAQEVFLGGDSYIQNGEFSLAVQGGHELTAGLFGDGWPMLYGYIAASPKTSSRTLLSCYEKDDPILTVWQYGLGRTVAWNSDVTGQWSAAFSGKEDYVQLWKRIIDYSAGNSNMGEDSVNVVNLGEHTQITYETAEYNGATEIYTTVISPDGEAEEVKLRATAPGRYEADVATPEKGLYHFDIRRTEGGEILSYMTTAAAVQFSHEYKFDVSTAPYLNFVNQYGREITAADKVWNKLEGSAVKRKSLTDWLLALAILLFLADVAMRRFQYVPAWVNAPMRGRRRRDLKESVDAAPDGRALAGENVAGDFAGKSAAEGLNGEKVGAAGAGESRAVPEALAKTSEKSKSQSRKKQKVKPQEQTLDTSQLLKKKDDRKI